MKTVIALSMVVLAVSVSSAKIKPQKTQDQKRGVENRRGVCSLLTWPPKNLEKPMENLGFRPKSPTTEPTTHRPSHNMPPPAPNHLLSRFEGVVPSGSEQPCSSKPTHQPQRTSNKPTNHEAPTNQPPATNHQPTNN